MGYEINTDNGWVNRGNLYRMKQLMRRAKQGDRMTLAFLGGSITQGSLSSQYTNCYAYLVYDWFVKRFPKTAFTYVNAGVGGTTSQFGVARADEDVLRYKPDFVIIEFSVNDEDTEFYQETYEGLVRKIYGNISKPAVLLVHNICYDTGVSAERVHREIGSHYNLPSVSMKTTIYPEVVSGAIENRQITPDDLHPNSDGHALLAEVVTAFLDKVYVQMEEEEKPFAMPAPLTTNAYAQVKRYQNHNSAPECSGFTADKTFQKYVNDMFRGDGQPRKRMQPLFSRWRERRLPCSTANLCFFRHLLRSLSWMMTRNMGWSLTQTLMRLGETVSTSPHWHITLKMVYIKLKSG
jgi:lysophospholipase L1-like esterase